MEKEIRELISKIAKVPVEKLTDDMRLFTDLGVDSLMGVEIFAALDQKYNLDIPENKLKDIQTVKDIISLVKELKASK